MKFNSLSLLLVSLWTVGTAAGAERLLKFGSSDWKYRDHELRSEQGWRTDRFDDANWQDGRAILGYGDRDVRTQLSFGRDPRNKRPVAFFRRRVVIRGGGRFRRYVGRVCCDDGAVVFINGKEVFRQNMPSGQVTERTYAVRSVGSDLEAERKTHAFIVEPRAVSEGENLIAVSVHQANSTSSDLAFDLELTGLETEAEVKDAEASMQEVADTVKQSLDEAVIGPVFHFNTTRP